MSSSDYVSYHYYRGFFSLLEFLDFEEAEKHLECAFWTMVRGDPENKNVVMLKDRQLVLIRLISCKMIMGKRPSEALWKFSEAEALRPYFEPIASAISSGDYVALCVALNSPGRRDWFMNKGVHSLLWSHLPLLCFAGLCRRVARERGRIGVSQENPNIPLDTLIHCLRFSLTHKPQALPVVPRIGSARLTVDEDGDPLFTVKFKLQCFRLDASLMDRREVNELVQSALKSGLLKGKMKETGLEVTG